MFLTLERGAHESAQDGSHGVFACLVDPQPKGALHAFGRVWDVGVLVKPCCTRGVSVGMCMDAPFGAGATLVMVHLDRREVGGEPESYARCRRCRVASIF